jgi:hypothetical protein
LPAGGQPRQATPQADVVAAAFTAEVTGKVQKVDPQTKPGDTVTVAFGLVKEPPSASPPTSPGSKSK